MDDPQTTMILDIAAGLMWSALRICKTDHHTSIIGIRPAAAHGFVMIEALAECRALALTLEAENAYELPHLKGTLGIRGRDVSKLKRANPTAERVTVEVVHGQSDPLLAIRSHGGNHPACVYATPCEPIELQPHLAPVPPAWEGPTLPIPTLASAPRLMRGLQALVDATGGACNVELMASDHPMVGIILRPIDDSGTSASVQVGRMLRLS